MKPAEELKKLERIGKALETVGKMLSEQQSFGVAYRQAMGDWAELVTQLNDWLANVMLSIGLKPGAKNFGLNEEEAQLMRQEIDKALKEKRKVVKREPLNELKQSNMRSFDRIQELRGEFVSMAEAMGEKKYDFPGVTGQIKKLRDIDAEMRKELKNIHGRMDDLKQRFEDAKKADREFYN